ncbi:telomere stability and silencing-domain-containing protein, partial [Rhodofomes roseus]
MSTSILVSAFAPFPTLSLSAPSDASFSSLYDLLADRYPELPSDLLLTPHRGCAPPPDAPLSSLQNDTNEPSFVSLRLVPRLRGGKGGFGSQLRAAGGRMSSQKTSNNDSCRDLSGRRLSTIKEAKKLADYIESEPLRKKAQQEAQRAKLEALEKKLGIVHSADGSKTSSEPLAGTKHRLDDTEYLEQSREIVDNVKNAVSVAMLKKRKKAKTSQSSPAADKDKSGASSVPAAIAEVASSSAAALAGKVLESATTAPVVVAAAS